ncbi:MAG: tectonin domain-containing protein [Terriglobales bacterium]
MSRKTACFVLLVLTCWAMLVVPASAQHFQQVKGTLASVSAGRNEVFGVDTHSVVWRLNPKTSAFVKVKKASLVEIAVGGGTLSQLDEVWGLNAKTEIFRFDYTSKTFVQITGELTQITVGPGSQDDCHQYEVWGVNPDDEIFRYNYCTNAFDQVSGSLAHVATSDGDVWGISSSGTISHFNFAKGFFVGVSGNLAQIAVGVNDFWGVNSLNQVFRYDPATSGFNVIMNNVSQVSAGGDGVWLIDTSSNIWRFDSGSESFVEVGGVLKSIAVGSGTGVFGVNAAGQVFTFLRP